jgi:hypothetical protein
MIHGAWALVITFIIFLGGVLLVSIIDKNKRNGGWPE